MHTLAASRLFVSVILDFLYEVKRQCFIRRPNTSVHALVSTTKPSDFHEILRFFFLQKMLMEKEFRADQRIEGRTFTFVRK